MIKKQNFKSIIEALMNQIERERKLTKSLESFFDGNFVSEISSDFQESVLDAIEDELKDGKDEQGNDSWIRWWLFDAPAAGKNKKSAWVVLEIGEEILLHNIDQLYDFLTTRNDENV